MTGPLNASGIDLRTFQARLKAFRCFVTSSREKPSSDVWQRFDAAMDVYDQARERPKHERPALEDVR